MLLQKRFYRQEKETHDTTFCNPNIVRLTDLNHCDTKRDDLTCTSEEPFTMISVVQ